MKPFNVITGLEEKLGVFDDGPLYKYLYKMYTLRDMKIRKKFGTTCMDAVSGNWIKFNETTAQPIKAYVSSSSIPFVFPDQVWSNGVVYIDCRSAFITKSYQQLRDAENR